MMAKTIVETKTPDLSGSLSAELLGRAIKAKRTQSQLKIEDAAMLCGVAKQTLLALEHGKATIKLDSILKICQGLGVNIKIEPWANNEAEAFDEWQ